MLKITSKVLKALLVVTILLTSSSCSYANSQVEFYSDGKNAGELKNITIYANGKEVKYRNLENEVEYFKKNGREINDYYGLPFVDKGQFFIPIKKTFNALNIRLDELPDKHYLFEGMNGEKYITSDGLKKLGIQIEYRMNSPKDKSYEIHLLSRGNSIKKISTTEEKKYQDTISYILKERKTKDNLGSVGYFINDYTLPLKMNLVTDSKGSQITIPEGYFLENYAYGKMILLKDGKIIGDNIIRKKEDGFLSYYLNPANIQILNESDEIIIFCPYCPSEVIIKVDNPFASCDCLQ